MIDLNYNNHIFLKTKRDFIYKCTKCKILVHNKDIGNDNFYWLIDENCYHIGKMLDTLNCEEMIIKQIIE